MISEKTKVSFRRDVVSVFVNGNVYEFLVLGIGIIPISKNIDLETACSVRRFLKVAYSKELKEIDRQQFEQEIICNGKY